MILDLKRAHLVFSYFPWVSICNFLLHWLMMPVSWIYLSTILVKLLLLPRSSRYLVHYYFWMRLLPWQAFQQPWYHRRPFAKPSYPCRSSWVTQWSCIKQRQLVILAMIRSSQASSWLPASWSTWTAESALSIACNGASCSLGSEPSGPWIRSLDVEDNREGSALSLGEWKVILLIIGYPR